MPENHAFAAELVPVYRQTLDGRLLDCNTACARMLGYGSREELLTVGRLDYFNQSDHLSIAAALPDLGQLGGVEVALRRRDGSIAWVLQNLRLVRVDAASKEWVEGVMVDVTEQRTATQRLEYQAYHDSLTMLPNRSLVVDRLNVALARSRRRRRPAAVLLIDLDHFELINTAFGHGIADRALKATADRLVQCVRKEDSIGRFGSDEFIAVLAEMSAETDAAIAAQRIIDSISQPLVIDGHVVDLRATVGIGVAPQDGADAEALIKSASNAMYLAKERGRNTYRFYVDEMNARAFERASLVNSLRRALADDELEVYYHPEVNVQTGRIECIEALLRWRHPDLGLIAPPQFLPAAEQGNLDSRINEWVINEVCKQARIWRDQGIRNVRVALNLSSRQFFDRGLRRMLDDGIRHAGIDPRILEIEISEATMGDVSRTRDILRDLKDLGTSIAIDDYGSGGCSMSELKQLPVDTLKIAPLFVQNMLHRADDASIVQAMITMAKGLDLRIVAEGVESKEQLSYLLMHRCPEMQGFFFGKPLPAYALADTLEMQH
jgi:diguanylate cyclase (GGDEF)-like protein/PAS domain S-box-containing protein